MRFIVILLFSFPLVLHAQLYKAAFVAEKQFDTFEIIGKNAYLDYNVAAMYVELIWNDSIYYYQIKRTGKPWDKKRFTVTFEDTDDSMMWNTTKEGDYIFVFNIGMQTLWFRNLSNPLREEYLWVKRKIKPVE